MRRQQVSELLNQTGKEWRESSKMLRGSNRREIHQREVLQREIAGEVKT